MTAVAVTRDPSIDAAVSLGARGLYAVLAHHWADDPERICRAQRSTLVAEAAISDRSLTRYLAELVAARYVVVVKLGRHVRAYGPYQPE